jgi:hypothetical protein
MTDADAGAGFGAEDDFEALLAESFISQDQLEGRVVHGTVVAIENDNVVIDVGLKTEGRISTREFAKAGEEIAVGDAIEVFLERIENALGDAVISREKASRWTAPLLAGSRAASRSIYPAPWHSCRAARWTFARCVTSRR